MTHLPEPDLQARALSDELRRRIEAEVDGNGDWIPFERFMYRALYEPGLGYYSAGAEKFGPGGDFVTAPELSDLLALALIVQFEPLLAALDQPVVLELGAGNGTLARDCLYAMDARGLRHVAYRILEPSATLRARQERLLERFGARVQWLSSLPSEPFDGLMLANEVIDALPASVFTIRGSEVLPVGVARRQGRLAWAPGRPDPALTEAVRHIESRRAAPLPDGYRSELRLQLEAWLSSVTSELRSGALVCIDYGLVGREYYHDERSQGTLLCHYRQRPLADPFHLPGLQDISAWVDFSATAEACRAAGLTVSGFTTQGLNLVAALSEYSGLTAKLADPRAAAALKTLMLPGEMGERFKVLLATRACESLGLAGRDLRNRL